MNLESIILLKYKQMSQLNKLNKQLRYNEEHKMQHKLQIEKIKSYLLDTKINDKIQKADSNSNVKGFVIAFNTKVKYKQTEKRFYKLSLLLYLDVRTARVERYLMNSSDPIANKKGIDFKTDLFYN
jgi:hypothetical protein